MYKIPFIDLPPLRGASGRVQLPGSKSISNRVLLLAGLAQGTTVVHDLLESDDTRVMLEALKTLGCGVEARQKDWHITGIGGRLQVHEAALFLGNAGTAMRPLAAALAVLAATQGGRFDLSGVPRMHERPIGDLVNALRPLGCTIDDLGAPGYPPLRLRGETGGVLQLAQPIRVRGDVSSQFLTALLLALPLACGGVGSAGSGAPIVIEVDGELISKPYVEITLNLLARFGIEIHREGFARFTIPAGSAYRSPGQIHIEGDASSASYFIALGAIAAHGGAPVRIDGVGADSIQGDIRFIEAAALMGAQIKSGPNWLEVHRGAWPLRAITLDCNHIPDAAMTLAMMALYADGPTRLNNIASWRVKETDRIAAMAIELRKLGAVVAEGADFIEVTPPLQWRAARVHTYDDHRMAMCLSLAAFNALAVSPASAPASRPEMLPVKLPVSVRIEDPACVAKTFPDYFEALFGLVDARPDDVPVITIDGPSASGKGTLASELAARLGYQLLDSGVLYRATGLAALQASLRLDGAFDINPGSSLGNGPGPGPGPGINTHISADDEAAVAQLASRLDLRFEGENIFLRGVDVTDALRREDAGAMASRVSSLPLVRQALHGLQLAFRRAPGLVADGRDMGTVVFPGAPLKVYLTASAEQRALRRYKQLISKGFTANIDSLRADLEARDARDRSRSASPLKPAEDALELDNSGMSIDESVEQVLKWWSERRPF